MVSLPPPTLPPPVQAALPNAAPPPVIVPAQVVAANLQAQLVRELTLPVSAVTVTQVPVAPAAPSPAQQILNAATPAAPAPAPPSTPATQLLLQIQTPQGTVQLALPATLPQQPLPQPGTTQLPVPATLTAPQWQQLIDQGHVQLQIAPVPAALLQRLPAGTPPLLAQLIIPPRDLANLLSTPLPQAPVAQSTGLALGVTPATFTATILPPALAETYKARFVLPAEVPPQTAARQNTLPTSTLQNAVTSVRNWFDALRPTVTPQPQPQTSVRIEPSLNQPTPARNAPETAPILPSPLAQATPPATPATAQPLRQVTISLIANPAAQQAQSAAPQATIQPSVFAQPSSSQTAAPQTASTPLAANTTETSARLLGLTPSGEKLVEIEDGQVLLAPAALPIAPGKTSTLRIASPLEANVTLQPERAPTLATAQPVLHETLEALTAAAPILAARLAGQVLLQPSAPVGTLAPSLLFLMTAMGITAAPLPGKPNGPTLSPALREALDTIESARGLNASASTPMPLAERLLTELRQLGTGREVMDDAGQPWRGFTLPTQMGETMQSPINFYIQQPQPRLPDQYNREGAAAPANTVKQTRFIVDMQLSKLGTTQLEGLSRARQLDLTLRTHTPLPTALQNDLTARYLEIASATGLTGTLQFGAGQGKGQWFTPRENANTSHMNARL